MRILKNPNFNFTGTMVPAAVLSAAVIVAGIVSLAVRGLNFGVEFAGGTMATARFVHQPSVGDVRSSLAAVGLGDAVIQEVAKGNQVLIRVGKATEKEQGIGGTIRKALYNDEEKGLLAAGRVDLNEIGTDPLFNVLYDGDPLNLGKTESAQAGYRSFAEALVRQRTVAGPLTDFAWLPAAAGSIAGVDRVETFLKDHGFFGGYMIVALESVGPSVGKELRHKAFIAVALALGALLVYVWFRFQLAYGFAAVVAIFHDVMVTIAFFSFTQREFSLTVLAALLTIAGFSINDTIVIFDRLRDNLKTMPGRSFPELVNLSNNQCLSRTVLTTGTVIVVTLSLFFLGGTVINDFAFAMLVGCISGTYSTVWVATAIVVVWERLRKRREMKARSR